MKIKNDEKEYKGKVLIGVHFGEEQEWIPDTEEYFDEMKYTHNLQSMDFRGATLNGVTFRGVDLKHSKFDGAILINTRFEFCDLSHTSFIGANFLGSTFEYVNMYSADFKACRLKGACIGPVEAVKGNFFSADFEASSLSHVNFKDANLQGASLKRTECYELNFSEAILSYTDFRSCTVQSIDPNKAFNMENNVGLNDVSNFHVRKRDITKANTLKEIVFLKGLKEEKEILHILKQAEDYSKKIFDSKEWPSKGEEYFIEFNTNLLKNIAVICIIDSRINAEEIDFETVLVKIRKSIYDFEYLDYIIKKIEVFYDIFIEKNTIEHNPILHSIFDVKQKLLHSRMEQEKNILRELRIILDRIAHNQKM